MSFLGIAAAWTYSVQLMTCWVMLAVVITILGASTTLTPVIMLRLIFIILGFQVGSRWYCFNAHCLLAIPTFISFSNSATS